MTAVPFPILRLPQRALQKSLKRMSIVEHLSLSFVSKNTKQLIKVFKEIDSCIAITLGSTLSIDIFANSEVLKFCFKSDHSIVEVHRFPSESTLEYSLKGFTETKWLEHFVDVFIRHKEVLFKVCNPPRRNIEDIYECIKDLKILKLNFASFQTQDWKILYRLPLLIQLRVFEDSFNTSIFVRNYSSVYAEKASLNNILAANCRNLQINSQRLSDKDLNIFMRHWIKGSNPSLRNLYVNHNEHIPTENVMFRSINYIKTLDMRVYKKFEIWRHDGTKAEVSITESRFHLHRC